MQLVSRQMAVVGYVLLFGVAAAAASWKQAQTRVISTGFSAVAMDEINQAFDGLHITFSNSHTAPYRVRVVLDGPPSTNSPTSFWAPWIFTPEPTSTATNTARPIAGSSTTGR